MDTLAREEVLFTEEDFVSYEMASTGQRFLNWVIDTVVMRYGLTWISSYALGYSLAYMAPELYQDLVYDDTYIVVLSLGIWFVNYMFYYMFMEKVFNGYTLGKLVTGTRVLREDGKPLTWKNAFIRSISRMVPFEAFSAWSHSGMWHDNWSRTMVVKSR